MGCTNCKSKTGCDHRKGEMLEQVDQALARLYPTRTWGEPDDAGENGHAGPTRSRRSPTSWRAS